MSRRPGRDIDLFRKSYLQYTLHNWQFMSHLHTFLNVVKRKISNFSLHHIQKRVKMTHGLYSSASHRWSIQAHTRVQSTERAARAVGPANQRGMVQPASGPR